ncbi:MAG: DnaD domain protein, partial [Clostridia bacterium]|nr:DnaD domain protein [Clostridia bacterium]
LLLLLCKDKSMCSAADITDISSKLCVTESDVILAFEKLAEAKLLREDNTIRVMSGLEISQIIDENDTIRNVIEECAKICGLVNLNNSDKSKIISLLNDLKMDGAALVLLFSYFDDFMRQNGEHVTVSYVTKAAYRLKLKTVNEITDYIDREHEKNSISLKLKKLFGVGKRQLSAKETEFFRLWTEEWQMPFDLIKEAFDRAVDSGSGNLYPYTSAILSDWHNKGVKTVDEIPESSPPVDDMSQKKKRREKQKDNGLYHSFDNDDYVRIMLKRSEEIMLNQNQDGKNEL